jgi:hypothetical protein
MDLSPLDRALRAARRGHHAAARTLLDEVLRFDPAHEEALLWRARAAESPAEARPFLERALAVNPDNRWAAQQLADGAGGATGGGGVDTLSCPSCGGSVTIHPERGPRAAMCAYCGSVLDLSSSRLDIIGQMDPKVGPEQPVRPGDEAVFFGENHLVMGWLAYEGWDDEDRWRWDEWQLVSDAGVPRYLSHSADEGWTIQTPVRPTPVVSARSIKMPEGRATITESGPARITAMQGEFTWRPRLGETLRVVEARRGAEHISAELTAEELEVVAGPRLTDRQVWEAFGRTEQLAALDARAEAARARRTRNRRTALLALVAAALYFVGIGYASTQGATLLSASTDFDAATATAPPPPAEGLPLDGARVALGTFDVADPAAVHELEVSAQRPPGEPDAPVAAHIQVETPTGELRTLLHIVSLSADGAPTDQSRQRFRPAERGTHTLYAYVMERSPDRLTLQTTVRSGVWGAGPFALSCGLAVLIALVLFLSGGFGRIE